MSAEALVALAAAQARGECATAGPGAAEGLLRRAIDAEGSDIARARAFRLLADRLVATGRDTAGLETMLDAPGRTGDAWIHGRAWLRFRQGRFAEAAALLQPLARPRHHTLPRWAIVHEDLGDSLAALDRQAEAQGQWRVALATGDGPQGTGWDRGAVERKLAAAATQGGAEPLVPVMRYPDALSLIDLGTIAATPAGVRYEKLTLLGQDEAGAAFTRFTRELDCGETRTRLLSLQRFDANGRPVASEPPPESWQPIRHDDPWLHTERRLVCGYDRTTPLRPTTGTDLERLQAYRREAAQ